MKRSIQFLIITLVAFAFIFAVAWISRQISGGDALVHEVVALVKTNSAVIEHFGDPITEVKKSNGPRHVSLRGDGGRYGYFSFSINGEKQQGQIRSEWSKQKGRPLNITRIWITKLLSDDKLLWEAASAETK